MSELQVLNHKHILVTATGLKNMPEFVDELNIWLKRVVEKIGMKILMGPYSIICDTVGNEGITGIVVIETSHCSVHIWSECENPFLKLDIYSCQDFDTNEVCDMINEFGPDQISYIVVDRNGNQAITVERKTIIV